MHLPSRKRTVWAVAACILALIGCASASFAQPPAAAPVPPAAAAPALPAADMNPEAFAQHVTAHGGGVNFVFEDDRPFASCHASTLAQAADGTLVCAWFGGTSESHDDVAIWLSRFVNDGWSPPVRVAKVNQTAHWNPVLFTGGDKKLYLFFKVGPKIRAWQTYWMQSQDGGLTWTEPVELVPGDSGGRGPVKNKAIILNDGTWLAPASTEFDGWKPFADRSTDQGATWTRSENFAQPEGGIAGRGAIQPTFWESQPGHVHALLRTTGGFIARTDSTDGGKTWAAMRDSGLPNNNSGIDVVKLDDGRLLLVYNPVKRGRTPIDLAMSTDNGDTWRSIARLESESGEYSYPAIIRTNDGVVISYTWKRERVRTWRVPLAALPASSSSAGRTFNVGFAQRDVTPKEPVPMWGYGDRHADLSQGVADPLLAKAVVFDVGTDKLALVGLDLGRSPREDMMERIRAAIREQAGVNWAMLVGSHTHHGPVIELKDEEGKGKGAFDAVIRYVPQLEQAIIDAIVEAAGNAQPAKLGWGSMKTTLNRNRHTKIEPKPIDDELLVFKIDAMDGKPLAILVNFAAHPTNIPSSNLLFSADYPGHMMRTVEAALGGHCVFLQGAAGDMSCQRGDRTVDLFGQALGEQVIEVAKAITTSVPANPAVKGMEQTFEFDTRLNFKDPAISTGFEKAFFPELSNAFMDEVGENKIRPQLTTVLLNGEVALVGGSGEFFCQHSIRLKERARDVRTAFLGYCNGHHMYFPTIEGASEGGYGAGPQVSWVEVGGPELMMNQALINIYRMLGKDL